MYIECKYSSVCFQVRVSRCVQYSCIPSWVLLQQGLISWICARRLHLGKSCSLHQFISIPDIPTRKTHKAKFVTTAEQNWPERALMMTRSRLFVPSVLLKRGYILRGGLPSIAHVQRLLLQILGDSPLRCELLRCRTNQVQALAVPCAQNEISLSLHLA